MLRKGTNISSSVPLQHADHPMNQLNKPVVHETKNAPIAPSYKDKLES
jgi:hypothetical protein